MIRLPISGVASASVPISDGALVHAENSPSSDTSCMIGSRGDGNRRWVAAHVVQCNAWRPEMAGQVMEMWVMGGWIFLHKRYFFGQIVV